MIKTERIKNDLEMISTFSKKNQEGTTRISYSKEYREAINYLKEVMRVVSDSVWEDDIGNLWCEIKSKTKTNKSIVIGSHLDTVNCGGYFDGQAGIVSGLEIFRHIYEEGIELETNLRLVAITMEEGSRFPNLSGSKFITGEYDDQDLDKLKDSDNCSLRQALKEFGYDGEIKTTNLSEEEIVAFLELHIEQGPLLENSDCKLGIVNSIFGTRWIEIIVTGETMHPSTPLLQRKDSGFASTWILSELYKYCANEFDRSTTVTFGQMRLAPNAINAISNETIFSIDIRGSDEINIEYVQIKINELCKQAKEKFCVETSINVLSNISPTKLDSDVIDCIKNSSRNNQLKYINIDSGAGHDAMVFAKKFKTGMIFVPSKNGITHSPNEWTDYIDIKNGTKVLFSTIQEINKRN